MGAESWLTADLIECVRGNVANVSDQYLKAWDGKTLPGKTADGRNGASVNHRVLAGGIAAYKKHSASATWWDSVADDWAKNGIWSIEDGTRNAYFSWNQWPVAAAYSQLGNNRLRDICAAIWARVALGASNVPARFGNVGAPGGAGTWKGYASTFCGARSWRRKGGYMLHLERNEIDWQLHWAITNQLKHVPQEGFTAEMIRGGLPSCLNQAQKNYLGDVVSGSVTNLARVVAIADLYTVHVPVTYRRTTDGVMTLRHTSTNGNTEHLYGATFSFKSQWHEWLAHGLGVRPNKRQGTAASGKSYTCRSNDGTQTGEIASLTGKPVYDVYCDRKGSFEIVYPSQGKDPVGLPVEPPVEPPVDPPQDGDTSMTQEERDFYVGEISQMASRQSQLATQLAGSTTNAEDSEVAVQLNNQSNKAGRLSDEIASIVER